MSCRPALQTHRERTSSPTVPTKVIENQSDIQTRVGSYEDGNESDSVESGDEVEQTNRTVPVTAPELTLEQSGLTLESTPTNQSEDPPNTPPSPKPTAKPEQKQMPALVKSKSEPQPSSQFKLIFYALIFILPLIACSRLLNKEPQEKRCAFEALRQRQPLQLPVVWKALQINIELMLNKKMQSPNVFLFLHSKNSNKKKIQTLIQDIALETSKCFDGQQPIEMSLKDFETKDDDDYGYPIEQYKKKLREGNVFLIVNLNDISPNAARALHTICDTHNPIASDVVIFLNLRTHLTAADGGPSQVAYWTLKKLWDELPNNELDALITRVIDQVQWLQS